MQLSESEVCSILNSIHPVMGSVVERLITEKNQKIGELAREVAALKERAAHSSDGQLGSWVQRRHRPKRHLRGDRGSERARPVSPPRVGTA